jgi:hypothetical protein
MNFAIEGLTVFAVVISRLQAIPLSWAIGVMVASICGWVLVAMDMRRNRPSQEQRVGKEQPSRVAR